MNLLTIFRYVRGTGSLDAVIKYTVWHNRLFPPFSPVLESHSLARLFHDRLWSSPDRGSRSCVPTDPGDSVQVACTSCDPIAFPDWSIPRVMGSIEEIGLNFRSSWVFHNLGKDLERSGIPSILCGIFYHKMDPCGPYVVCSHLEITDYLWGKWYKHASWGVSSSVLSAD